MSCCCDEYTPGNLADVDKKLECANCGGAVDNEGDSLELCCGYSPILCDVCGDAPCDGSC